MWLSILGLLFCIMTGTVSAAEPGAEITTPGLRADAITDLSFQDTDLRSVFDALADLAGINVVFDPGLSGKVSITLRNVSVSNAISIVARAAKVSATIVDNLLIVSPKDPQSAATSVEEPQIRVYSLQYAEPAKVVEMAPIIIPGLKLTGEDVARRVVVRGTATDLAQFESFLNQFDKAGRQVFIEARVQEVSRDALRQLGINWSLPSFGAEWDPKTSTLSATMKNLGASLDALESSGNAHLLASPHITAVSGETATIFVGDRVPIVLKGGTDKEDQIEYIEAGISLEIIARVGADGLITTHVKPQVSSIASWTPQGMPQVRSRNAETTVRVRDGQPIVIGGLIKEEDRKNMSQVTGLGSIPILGALFRTNRTDSTQMETVIILTPHLVDESATLSMQPVTGDPASITTSDSKVALAAPTILPAQTDANTTPTPSGAIVSTTSETQVTALEPSTTVNSVPGTTKDAALASPTHLFPLVAVSADVTAGTPGHMELSLRYPPMAASAAEIRLVAPLPSNLPATWSLGADWRVSDGPVWLRFGVYNSFTPNPWISRGWDGELALGLTAILKQGLFVEPYAGMRIPLATGSPANNVGILVGLSF